ncbi:MAG: UDP-2,3-diacylglucosamine diphosphatase [Chitinophagales bacterium]|nr:UDP-2,3-diacylglucosamine diphosphatase [Chitinophagales bacterium]
MGSKLFFASDLHLGFPDHTNSLIREKKFIRWLDSIAYEAHEIFLVGDIFDFWFDYKRSVPKGFTRILGKIAELCDRGIKIHYFTGNHDVWLFGYFEDELGVQVHKEEYKFNYQNKEFYVAHGDGLGPGDHGYKFLKKVFTNRFCQWLFSKLHPDLGIGIAKYWSLKSREHSEIEAFLGEDKEWLVIHSKELLKEQHFDYFIYGHRHIPVDIEIGQHSRYINLGDWIDHFTYAEFADGKLELKHFVE